MVQHNQIENNWSESCLHHYTIAEHVFHLFTKVSESTQYSIDYVIIFSLLIIYTNIGLIR